MKLIKKHLPINEFSNPGTPLKTVMAIVLHWVANPKTDNLFTYKYFRGLQSQTPGKEKLIRYAGVHYGVDPSGIMQYVPEEYLTYNCGAKKYTKFKKEIFGHKYPNAHVIAIEMHHPDWSGKPEIKTYNHLMDLLMNLCDRYNLDPREKIVRHYDITGKDCPKWYVNNPELFNQLKLAVYNNLLLWKNRNKLDMR